MQVAEIIINSCYGGFSFSDKAIEEYKKYIRKKNKEREGKGEGEGEGEGEKRKRRE